MFVYRIIHHSGLIVPSCYNKPNLSAAASREAACPFSASAASFRFIGTVQEQLRVGKQVCSPIYFRSPRTLCNERLFGECRQSRWAQHLNDVACIPLFLPCFIDDNTFSPAQLCAMFPPRRLVAPLRPYPPSQLLSPLAVRAVTTIRPSFTSVP